MKANRPVSSFLTIGYNIAVRVLYKPFERRQKQCFSPAHLISATALVPLLADQLVPEYATPRAEDRQRWLP
jgi:hypothetical protein